MENQTYVIDYDLATYTYPLFTLQESCGDFPITYSVTSIPSDMSYDALPSFMTFTPSSKLALTTYT